MVFGLCCVPSLPHSPFTFVQSWICCQRESWVLSRYICILNLQHCEILVCQETVYLNCRHLPLFFFFSRHHWNTKAWLLKMLCILYLWVVQSVPFLTGNKTLIFKYHFHIFHCWKRGIVRNSCRKNNLFPNFLYFGLHLVQDNRFHRIQLLLSALYTISLLTGKRTTSLWQLIPFAYMGK